MKRKGEIEGLEWVLEMESSSFKKWVCDLEDEMARIVEVKKVISGLEVL